MKFRRMIGWSSALWLSAVLAQAQETNSIEQLKQQLKEATEKFDKALQEQRRVIEDLNRRLDAVQKQPAPEPPPPPAASSRPGALSIGSGRVSMDVGLIGTFAAGTSSARDIEGGTQLGGHDPNQRGFTVQGVEVTFSGAVDPYFRANANVLFSIDASGESFVELEEAFMETISLPANLQLRGGQYLTEFGRHNPTHPHAWAFVDTPLVSGRFLGPDGLRNPGARLSWLMPTPFYSELFFSVQDSHGETATGFRSAGHSHGGEEGLPSAYRHPDNDRGIEDLGDLLFAPRYAVSFELTEAQTLLLGASAAFGPNSSGGEDGGETDTQIYGVDFTWKWKSPTHSGGFPFVAWQTEGMLRRYEAGRFDWDENGNGLADDGEVLTPAGTPAVLSGETLVDYGFYTQLLYGFRKGWIAGLRFDYLTGDEADYERAGLTLDGEALGRDPSRASRWRLSPNLTWHPSEFSKVRLQYNYDDRNDIGTDHSVWLQFEFILGAHGAHKF